MKRKKKQTTLDEGILHYVLLLIFNLKFNSIFLNNSYNVPKFVSAYLFSSSIIIPHWNTHNHLFLLCNTKEKKTLLTGLKINSSAWWPVGPVSLNS